MLMGVVRVGDPEQAFLWHIVIQAYYSPACNQIIVPGGIMQPPVYYGPRLPRHLTYGAFGSLMGHEISHGQTP